MKQAPIRPLPLHSVLPPELAELPFRDRSDAKLIREIIADALGSKKPHKAARPLGTDIYTAMSVLQKAIRLGKAELAARASASLIGFGRASTAWKRLRTIAVEDIGVGDPDVAAFVLWLASRKDLHQEFGDERLSTLAVRFLCSAVRSRDMCDVAFWSTLPGAVDHLVKGFAGARSSELVLTAADEAEPFQVRHAAARALFPARFRGVRPWKRRPPEDRLPLYEALRMPRSLTYAIEADVSFGGDVLTSAGPLVWALLRSSSSIATTADPFDPAAIEMINGMPASTFDRHTRVGHQVLRRMLQEHPPWIDFFRRYPRAEPMHCVLRSLFYVEGGVLRPRLSYDRASDLYWSVLEAKFTSTGIISMEEGGWELLSLTQQALPRINQMRGQALAQAGHHR